MTNLVWKQGTGYTGFASEVGECWTLVDNDEWPTLRVQGGANAHTIRAWETPTVEVGAVLPSK